MFPERRKENGSRMVFGWRCVWTCECRADADLTWSSAMILSLSSSSSPTAGGAVTGGGVTGLGLVSGGTLVGLFWGVGGGVSSSCR